MIETQFVSAGLVGQQTTNISGHDHTFFAESAFRSGLELQQSGLVQLGSQALVGMSLLNRSEPHDRFSIVSGHSQQMLEDLFSSSQLSLRSREKDWIQKLLEEVDFDWTWKEDPRSLFEEKLYVGLFNDLRKAIVDTRDFQARLSVKRTCRLAVNIETGASIEKRQDLALVLGVEDSFGDVQQNQARFRIADSVQHQCYSISAPLTWAKQKAQSKRKIQLGSKYDELPIVFGHEASGILFHEAVGHALESDHLGRNGDSLLGQIGEKVGPDFLNVSANELDFTDTKGALLDYLGTKTREIELIKDGVLLCHIGSQADGGWNTGNDYVDSYKNQPLVRMMSLSVSGNAQGQEYSVTNLERGIMVTSVRGGLFNAGSSIVRLHCDVCFLIEDGKVSDRIDDLFLEQNSRSILSCLIGVGEESRWCSRMEECEKHGQSVLVAHRAPDTVFYGLSIRSMV